MPVLGTCNPNPPQAIQPDLAGHGTHTAGLIAANGGTSLDVAGTCKHCGVAMWKSAFVDCGVPFGQTEEVPQLAPNSRAWAAALALSGDIGAQVVNMSFVTTLPNGYPCEHFTEPPPMCLGLTVATHRDVAMVAASGNDRTLIHFPARDPRVIAAGGYQPDGTLWDEMPSGDEADCPLYDYGLEQRECGSNYSIYASGPRQELVTSAKSVLSTTYPQYNWSPAIRCGDQFQFSGTAWGGGTGLCTGTSMSAPQVAGLLGLIRSINPLVPFGDAPATQGTLRHVLASTASRAQAGLGWDAELGYGIPDAEAAARKMLGKVARAPVRNRAIPLFRLRSAAANGGVGDYADTSSPQSALAMMLNAKNAWVPSGPPTAAVPYYPQFPHGPDEGPAANAAPRAPVLPPRGRACSAPTTATTQRDWRALRRSSAAANAKPAHDEPFMLPPRSAGPRSRLQRSYNSHDATRLACGPQERRSRDPTYEEFRRHGGRACRLPTELPFPGMPVSRRHPFATSLLVLFLVQAS